MILRIELPKPLPKGVIYAQGITVYLNGRRIDHLYAVDWSISKYADSAKWIDKRTCEIEGEFEVRKTTDKDNYIKGQIVVYGK